MSNGIKSDSKKRDEVGGELSLSKDEGVLTNSIVPDSATLLKLITSYKRVSRFSCETSLNEWINTVNLINSLERDVVRIGDFEVSDYMIPNALKELILPNSVTLTGVSGDTDILVRPKITDEIRNSCLSRNDFNDVSAAISAAIYKDASKVEPIIKGDVKYEAAYDKGSYNKLVVRSTTPFFPIPIDLKLKKEVYYNFDVDIMVHDAIVSKFKENI